MMKFIFTLQLTGLLLMPFAASADYSLDQTLSQIALQIKAIQTQISTLATKFSQGIAPALVVSVTPKTVLSFVDLSVNGEDGPVTIPVNSPISLAWKLSDHNWSYCTKVGSWSGGFKPVSGSEIISNIPYGQTYALYCYIDGTRYSDSVIVNVIVPVEKKAEKKLEPTPSIAVPSSCNLSVSKPSVTIGKDAIEATWIVKSDPPGWPFYWYGTDNGKEFSQYYGGTTDAVIVSSYNNTPAVYTRYFEVVQGTGFVVQDPNHPPATCTSNTVTFEIKASSSREVAQQFLANVRGAISNFLRWLSN